jgi:molybdopterin synthase sulfur carrier subunit
MYLPGSHAMTITVKFFSSLRESLDISSQTLNAQNVATVIDAWNQATNGAKMPDNILVAINMDYVERGHIVKDGDEIAFFPPVTGG